MNKLELTNNLLGIILNIPVWAIAYHFASQSVKRRNEVEKRIGITLDKMKDTLAKQNERIAILETRLENGRSAHNCKS